MSLSPSVALVILNWNGRKHLEEFLPSVMLSAYPGLRIIVGDNGSTDDSLAFLNENYPGIELIRNSENLGFAAGYNEVLRKVDTDYFVLLNSDVKVGPDWIRPVIELMESDPDIVVAQPKIMSYTRPEYFEHAGAAGGLLDMFGYPFCRGRMFDTLEKDLKQYEHPVEIFWASGAAFFIKRNAWEQAGGFDPDFFAHMEEIDLCWRLKNAGFKVVYCPEAQVYHLGGGSLSSESPYKTYLNFRNNLFMLQKNLPMSQAIWVIFCRFWLDFIALIRFFFEGRSDHAKAVSRAHVDFLENLSKTAKKAGDINKLRFNRTGFIQRSIIWEYFVAKKRTYTEL